LSFPLSVATDIVFMPSATKRRSTRIRSALPIDRCPPQRYGFIQVADRIIEA
jgi:hypothetical protein